MRGLGVGAVNPRLVFAVCTGGSTRAVYSVEALLNGAVRLFGTRYSGIQARRLRRSSIGLLFIRYHQEYHPNL